MARKKSFNQIIRVDGRNTFVEFMDSAFEIGKVLVNFISYDTKTNKQSAMIPFYIDMADFLLLEADVLSGRIAKLAEVEKAKTSKGFPNSIYMQQGGVSAHNLKQRGKERPDGMSLARQLKIIPGSKVPFMVQAEQGKGEENATGLIVSRYGSKPDDRVMVPMTNDDLKKSVLIVGAKIRAYLSAQYVYMNKTNFNKQLREEEEYVAQFRKKA